MSKETRAFKEIYKDNINSNSDVKEKMRKQIRKEYENFAICVIILGLIMMTILISTSIEPSNYLVLIVLTIIIYILYFIDIYRDKRRKL